MIAITDANFNWVVDIISLSIFNQPACPNHHGLENQHDCLNEVVFETDKNHNCLECVRTAVTKKLKEKE